VLLKHYTMIGSRKTPNDIQEILKRLATKLDTHWWIVRSGGADGADSCCNHVANKEIYIPWNGFNGFYNGQNGAIAANTQQSIVAEKIVSTVHPAWGYLKQGAQKLHTRNVFQVLGLSLDTPSKFVVCWAPTAGSSGEVKGGTATAVKIALNNNIPVYNLYNKEHLDKVMRWLNG